FGTIYSYSNDHRTARALIAASYGNRDINVTEIELGVDNLKPEFLSKFPLGKVPAFEGADGYTLYESNAISRYLGGDALSGGSDPRIASLISQFVGLNDRELVPAETVWLYPIYGWLPHNAEMVARAKEEVSRVLAYLDSHLLSRTFLVGESVTLADITLVTTLQNFYKTVFDKDFRKRFGNVNRWFLTCVNQPNFAKVLGEVKLVE
ncbi:glutathione S-transferase, partial [Cladochytrium replicatum]